MPSPGTGRATHRKRKLPSWLRLIQSDPLRHQPLIAGFELERKNVTHLHRRSERSAPAEYLRWVKVMPLQRWTAAIECDRSRCDG